MTGRAAELSEIAPILATAKRHPEIRAAALLLPEACRWRDALTLTAERLYSDAATHYIEIGSHPLAADAHLLAARQAADEGRTADAYRHAQAVLGFAERTGASLYAAARRGVRQSQRVARGPACVVESSPSAAE